MADKQTYFRATKRFRNAETGLYVNKGDLVPLEDARARKLNGRGLVEKDAASAADVKAWKADAAEREAAERAKAEERLAAGDRSARAAGAGRGPTVSARTGEVVDPGDGGPDSADTPEPDGLDEQDEAALRELAKAEEIDLGDAADQAAVLAAIRQARADKAAEAAKAEGGNTGDGTRKPRR